MTWARFFLAIAVSLLLWWLIALAVAALWIFAQLGLR